MDNKTNGLYEFGPFRLDAQERRLIRGKESIAIPPKAFDTLLVLVRNSGRLLEKEDLLKSIWPESFVEEGNLSLNISILRKALGDKPAKAEYIETVPKRGYRFIAEVRAWQEDRPKQAQESPSNTAAPDEETCDGQQQAGPFKSYDRVFSRERTVLSQRSWKLVVAIGGAFCTVLILLMSNLWAEDVPRINDVVFLSDPVHQRQFFVKINGSGFDSNAVQVVVIGLKGCPRIGNCVVPNNVLHGVSSTQIESAPLTLDEGEFQIYVRNGAGGPISNGVPVTINPSVPLPRIIVDGHPHEWAGLKPLLEDPSGDGPFNSYGQYYKGQDFMNISVSNDDNNLYFLLEFSGDYTGGIGLFLDTDLNASTGCKGSEYLVFVSSTAPGANLALADWRNCSFKDDFPEAIVSKAQGRFVEASIKIDTLRIITPRMIGMRMSATALAPGKGEADTVGPETTYLLK